MTPASVIASLGEAISSGIYDNFVETTRRVVSTLLGIKTLQCLCALWLKIEKRVISGISAVIEARVKRPEALIQKVYFLQNDCKTKMQNEESLLINHNHSKNTDNGGSFCKTPITAKRNAKLQNESEWEPEDAVFTFDYELRGCKQSNEICEEGYTSCLHPYSLLCLVHNHITTRDFRRT